MKKFKNRLLKNLIFIIGIVETIFLVANSVPREGLEFMWLLPLTFCSCALFFRRIFDYHHGGLGLKVAYIIEIIRYLILPFLISISNGEISIVRMSIVPEISYRYAILIQCIEIIVFFTTIYYCYPKLLYRIEKNYKKKSKKFYLQNIQLCGWIIFIIFVLFLLLRVNIWLPALNISFLKISSVSTKIVFENTILSCVKIIILILAIKYVQSCKYKSRRYFLGIFFLIIWLLFSSLSYFGTNRVYVIENLLTSIMLVIIALPQTKKLIITIVVPSCIALVFSMLVTKQFSLDTAEEFSTSILSVQLISNTVEEYVNGPWTIAQTHNSSQFLPILIRYQAFGSDLASGLKGIGDLPLIKQIVQSTEEWKTSSEIMKSSFQNFDRGQMLSLSAGVFIWFGPIIGWFIFPIVNYILVRFLIICEIKSKIIESLYYKYMYIWMGILLGLMHCYCIETILYCWSKFILIYWGYLKVNSIPILFRKK